MAKPEEFFEINLVDPTETYGGDIPVPEKGFYWDGRNLVLYENSTVPMFARLIPHNCKERKHIVPEGTVAEWSPIRANDADGNRLGDVRIPYTCLCCGEEVVDFVEERVVKPQTLPNVETTKFTTV